MGEVEVQDHSAAFYKIRYSGWGHVYHRDLVYDLMEGAHGKVLDAGCGPGFVSALYPHSDITGIDLSQGMLKDHPGKHYLMSVCNLPPHWDAQYDFVLCRSLLHHLPDHKSGLKEMARVLKPGGRIAFLETNKSVLATLIRQRTQHGGRFSEYHHSFKDTELIRDIRAHFVIDEVKYVGFLAYPLWGFRDLIDFQRYLPGKSFLYYATQAIDEGLSHVPLVRKLSWAIMVRGHRA